MPIINLKRLAKSFKYAARGLKYAWQEQNFRIQLALGIVVLILIFCFRVTTTEAAILILLSTIVLVLELTNTVFERISNMLKPRFHHYAAMIKDIMAAVVLLASIGATIIGLLIFIPYILKALV